MDRGVKGYGIQREEAANSWIFQHSTHITDLLQLSSGGWMWEQDQGLKI